MILYHPVGLKHITPDLTAPGNLLLLPLNLGHFLLFFPLFQLVYAGPENPQRGGLVLMLGSLVLAGNHDPGGDMGDTDGRIGNVDVLPSRAAGTEGIDSQIFLIDLQLQLFLRLGESENRSEGGMSPAAGVKGGDPDEPVDPGFRLEMAIGIRPFHGENRPLDSGFLTVLKIEDLDAVPASLDPAGVHPEEHLGPILRLGAPGPGIYGDKGVSRIGLIAEKGANFQVGKEIFDLPELPDGLPEKFLTSIPILLDQFDSRFQIPYTGFDLPELFDVLLQQTDSASDLLGVPGVIPEIRRGRLPLQFLDLRRFIDQVKDASPGSRVFQQPLSGSF